MRVLARLGFPTSDGKVLRFLKARAADDMDEAEGALRMPHIGAFCSIAKVEWPIYRVNG